MHEPESTTKAKPGEEASAPEAGGLSRWLPPLCVALTVFAMIYPTLGGYLWESHDSTAMVLRVDQLLKTWRGGGDWQGGWMPEVLNGHGMPFLTFYAPLGYYVAGLLALDTEGSIGGAIKWSFYLSLIVGAAGMYGAILTVGRRAGIARVREWGAAGAMAFTAAPYHYTDVFVRGSLAECWAFGLMPCVVWAMEAMRRRGRAGGWALAGLVGLLMISHNITALYGVGFIALYALLTCERARAGLRWVAWVAAAGAGGMALSAWFWLPAMRLKGLVRAGSAEVMMGTPERLEAHALHPLQFLMEQWGPGVSRVGIGDTMALNPGLLNMLGLGLALGAFFMRREAPGVRRWMLGIVLPAAGGMGMALSGMPWDYVPELLRYIQFPWRLMLFVVLCGSLGLGVAGGIVLRRVRPLLLAAPFVGMGCLFGAMNALKPPANADDAAELAVYWEEFEKDARKGLFSGYTGLDYAPLTAAPEYLTPEQLGSSALPRERIWPREGLSIEQFERNEVRNEFVYEAASDVTAEGAWLYFPGWELRIGGEHAAEGVGCSARGLVELRLPGGRHAAVLEYTYPPQARGARWVSGVSFLLWAGMGVWMGVGFWRRRREAV